MNGPWHYKEAERLLDGAQEMICELDDAKEEPEADHFIALSAMATLAQAHATLALTAATVGLDAIEGPNGGSATGRTAEDAQQWDEALCGKNGADT